MEKEKEKEKSGGQMKKGESHQEEKKGKEEEGLPMESSPYTQYKDLEDYKRQGYGTQGHQEPTTGRGAGSTDAPTPSGDAVQEAHDDHLPTDVIHRLGVP